MSMGGDCHRVRRKGMRKGWEKGWEVPNASVTNGVVVATSCDCAFI